MTDSVHALEKLTRLAQSGGQVIITAPFNSITHFAPYHYGTGFSQYFYRGHFERLGCEIVGLTANGSYFDVMDQELGRLRRVRKTFKAGLRDPVTPLIMMIARLNARLVARFDGPRMARRSSELQTFGWHVIARKAPR